MAVSRVKTWVAGEVLTASDLNTEFSNILTNSQDLGSPRTKAFDIDGQDLVIDQDGDTKIAATTDDRLDIYTSGTALFRFDGTVATPVNGLDFIATASGNSPSVQAVGADTNIDLSLKAKGTGKISLLDGSGNEIMEFTRVASAVNFLRTVSAATGNGVEMSAQGDDTNIPLILKTKGTGKTSVQDGSGNEVAEFETVASAVNFIKILASATGNVVSVTAQGDDTNITLQLAGKGTGTIEAASDIIPDTDSTKDLGSDPNSSGKAFAQAWVDTYADPASADTIAATYPVHGSGRAWVAYLQGTPAIADDFNVASVTDNTTGDFTVIYDVAFASADGHTREAICNSGLNVGVKARSTGNTQFLSETLGGTDQDTANWISFHGDLA